MLNHQPTVQETRPDSKRLPKAICRLTTIAAMAALAATAAVSSHAASGGELQDIELLSLRSPAEAAQTPLPASARAPAVAGQSAALTRAQVRESLSMARLANLVTPSGEMGDTADVLQAREDFNDLQAEVMETEYRTAALQLQQAQMDALVAQAEGRALAEGSAEPAPAEGAEPALAAQTVEVVVVSSDRVYEALLEGGHASDMARAKGPSEVEAAAEEGQVTVLLLVNESAPNGQAGEDR